MLFFFPHFIGGTLKHREAHRSLKWQDLPLGPEPGSRTWALKHCAPSASLWFADTECWEDTCDCEQYSRHWGTRSVWVQHHLLKCWLPDDAWERAVSWDQEWESREQKWIYYVFLCPGNASSSCYIMSWYGDRRGWTRMDSERCCNESALHKLLWIFTFLSFIWDVPLFTARTQKTSFMM